MKRLLIVSCAGILAIGTPALAQQAGKPIARADFIKNLDTKFNGIDTNHDGRVSRDEIAAAQQRDLQAAKAALDKRLQDGFRKLDTNRDGKLSLEEFMASEPAIKTTVTADQMLQNLDTNHDGKVSVEEFRAPQLATFNRIDINHDGVVTPQEYQAAGGKTQVAPVVQKK